MVGSEDFAIVIQNIFITQGDLHTCFDHGSLKKARKHLVHQM